MWNSEVYEPRHSISYNGIYTPAPSPPPEEKAAMEDEEEDEEEQVFHAAIKKEKGGQECISPADQMLVLASEGVVEEEVMEEEEAEARNRACSRKMTDRDACKQGMLNYYRSVSSSVSNGSSRLHPRATTSSESGK